jgi:two-component system, chemotaxis family, CheB/CheR fusion protein
MKSARSPDKKKSLPKNNPPLQSSAIGTDTSIADTRPMGSERKSSIVKADKASRHPFPVVAIGASAGGLEAITQLLKNLAPDTGMAFIYVQHLSPDHKSLLTPLLSKVTKMKVQDIDDMEKIQPDNVYIIPYNKEIEVIDGHIQLLPRPVNKSSNLSIDVLFSSLAETHGENVVGIVLSGSANDGTRGLKEIKLAGGITFAQDDSAKFNSMPNSAIAEGVVDFILSPKEIALQLGRMSKHPLANPQAIKAAPEDKIDNTDLDLKSVLQHIHKTKRVDFSHYKMNTIKRRMLRRMLIHKIDSIKDYSALLTEKKQETDLLFQDILINVTDFFRDTEAFEALKSKVLPKLLASIAPGETLRIWVAACATGEEAFSIGILLFELQEKKQTPIPFQIFASDLSAEAIRKARSGEFTLNHLKNISPKRLQRFFTKSKDKYYISKALRDVCIFAQHNILGDPPFSRMDLISSRNFMIYLDHPAQKKALATFHYALKEGGALLLGKSETIGSSTDLFTPLDKKYKIYTRKKNSGLHRIPDISFYLPHTALKDKVSGITPNSKKISVSKNSQLTDVFDAILLAQFAPASVIVNHDLDILQFRGNTAPYLQNAPGKASFNILNMAQPEITFELRNAIHHAIKSKLPVRKTGIEMARDEAGNTVRIVNLEAMPLLVPGEEPMVVIVFTGHEMELGGHPVEGEKKNSIAKDRRIKKLEEELAAARYDMRSITQDQESANEELQSANEEVISSNEELQSLNEELETSKEEIESTNEELITSNQELHSRILQVEELHNYNEAILDSVHDPMLVLDKYFCVKSANKSFCKEFRMAEENILGVSLYKLGNNEWNIPPLRELLEEIIPKNNQFHDFEVETTFPSIGHKIMVLNAHRIVLASKNEALIVLAINDVTEVRKLAFEVVMKKKELLNKALNESIAIQQGLELAVAERTAALQEQQEFSETLFDSSPDLIMVIDRDLRFIKINKKTASIFQDFYAGNVIGKTMEEVMPFAIKSNTFSNLKKVFELKKMLVHFEKAIRSDTYYEHSFIPLFNLDHENYAVMVISHDVTDRVQRENQIRELNTSFNFAEQIGLFGSFSYHFATQSMHFSDNLYRLVGCEPQEFEASSENFIQFIHPDDHKKIQDATQEAFVHKKASTLEYRLLRKDGQMIYVCATGKNFTDDAGKEWMVGTLQDITEAKRQDTIKSDLQAAKNQAELKTKIAEDIVIAKQQFLSNMSHEIRTPMNAIIGFTNVILKTKLEEKQKEYIHAIKESGDALLVLINDILDLAKVDSGKMTFEQIPFNLPEAVATMLRLFEGRIKEKNLVLTEAYDPAIPAMLVGDPLRLRQIMLNLISNAVKFTFEGEISIRVRLLKEQAEKVTIEFTLTDTGIGIPENKLAQIFNNFEQVYAEGGGAYGGTGLGLAIVKQLLERQGGAIRVESELGKGSTFIFTLSFNKATKAAQIHEEAESEISKEVKHLKILVAEDVALNQLLIRLIMSEFGFEADIAGNGKIAIEMLQKNRYDIILMDLQMPEMNGFDATRYIRKQMKDQTPIIALTADVTTVDLEKCLALGMNDYISKPIDEKLLFGKIMKCIKKSQ